MNKAVIAETIPKSIAEEIGLEKNDMIIKINEKTVEDLIQFQFEWAGEEVSLHVKKNSGGEELYIIEKDYDEPLGAIFTQAVFDKVLLCQNKCSFCFVDQLPRGMRPSLYIKDDDYRLSFLQGSYITLTNLTDAEIKRIIQYKLSPLYISVHTTVLELRAALLENPKAKDILFQMKKMSDEGIKFHTQVVLCPGINDGNALEKTYQDLCAIGGVISIALVPVGLTSYRKKLTTLRSFKKEEAQNIIAWAEKKQNENILKNKKVLIWPADEFYIIAEKIPPSESVYEDFPQLENGVGMIRQFWAECDRISLPKALPQKREIVCITGNSGKYVLYKLIEKLNKVKNCSIELKTIENSFFGPQVTVVGLLTGKCLLEGLNGVAAGKDVLIPDVMTRGVKDTFLDGMEINEVAEKLKANIIVVPASASGIVKEITSN